MLYPLFFETFYQAQGQVESLKNFFDLAHCDLPIFDLLESAFWCYEQI